eukprot:1152588-Pelagomonas_calceolata.AAC.11
MISCQLLYLFGTSSGPKALQTRLHCAVTAFFESIYHEPQLGQYNTWPCTSCSLHMSPCLRLFTPCPGSGVLLDQPRTSQLHTNTDQASSMY